MQTVTRYILVENTTDTIIGDSLDFKGACLDVSPGLFAWMIDQERGIDNSYYQHVSTQPADAIGYHVYCADDLIAKAPALATVKACCPCVGFVVWQIQGDR